MATILDIINKNRRREHLERNIIYSDDAVKAGRAIFSDGINSIQNDRYTTRLYKYPLIENDPVLEIGKIHRDDLLRRNILFPDQEIIVNFDNISTKFTNFNILTDAEIEQRNDEYLDELVKCNRYTPSQLDYQHVILEKKVQTFTQGRTRYQDSYDFKGSIYLYNQGAIDIFLGRTQISDTPLGIIGSQELRRHLTYNVERNLVEQSFGRINTDLVSIIRGERILRDYNAITVPKTIIGRAAEFLSRLRGYQLPFWYFQKLDKKNLSNEELLSYTSKLQTNLMLEDLELNKYRPLLRNLSETLLQPATYVNIDIENGITFTGTTQCDYTGKNSLIYKTEELIANSRKKYFIDSTAKEFNIEKCGESIRVSKGSGIQTVEGFVNQNNVGEGEVNLTEYEAGEFFRVWTKDRPYNQLARAIRYDALQNINGDIESRSIIQNNGLPKIGLSENDLNSDSNEPKKFMFSLENLAWSDNLAELPDCERGNGDFQTKSRGRIMWFPPYNLTFNENSNAQWTETSFIGRGEPLYTYNQSTRDGSISFTIVADHPQILNKIGNNSNNNKIVERYFAGDRAAIRLINDLAQAKMRSDLRNAEQAAQNIQLPQTESNVIETNHPSFIWGDDSVNIVNNIINGAQSATFQLAISTETADNFDSISDFEDLTSVENQIIELLSGIDDTLTNPVSTIDDSLNLFEIKVTIITNNVEDVQVTDFFDRPIQNINNDNRLNADQIRKLLTTECDYFRYLKVSEPLVFNELSNRIDYFSAGFHSTSSVGLNNRLTFLQQCMRQGDSIGQDDIDKSNNLAFGRPPVCILRIGDFFHTKIVIETLNITYDNIKWDLNPDGIGVQPMLANITLQFKIIGGQSIKSPFNRLQNGLSFNYYANTELYDQRAYSVKQGTGLSENVQVKRGIDKIFDDNNPNLVSTFAENDNLIGLINNVADEAIASTTT